MPTRTQLLHRLTVAGQWDLAVIGGGATGLGIALDAASRGHSVILVEASDFAKGTSSRATKLLHGGVRYLAQGNVRLVYEALRERAVILENAPHLTQRLAFVIPAYCRQDRLYYGAGLTAYSWLAGRRSLGRTEWLDVDQTLRALPTVKREGLVGGVRYWDAQFDDARLALALARTAGHYGALVLNYCAATALLHEAQRVTGFACTDQETGASYQVRARCVVNATGVWSDLMRQADADLTGAVQDTRIQASRGTHLVLDTSFLPAGEALLIPRTSDDRVLFAVPWQGKVLVGTTDVPTAEHSPDPDPTDAEVDFILRELGAYLERKPSRDDILSAWAGLRPLTKPQAGARETRAISREHEVLISGTGLVSVTGGKWTTYRVIARDVMEACYAEGLLDKTADCLTAGLKLVGASDEQRPPPLRRYGSEAPVVQGLPGWEREIAPELTEAMVRFAVRFEFARSVDDVLARRIRMLFLDAKLAGRCAADVAQILEEEGIADPKVDEFLAIADRYARLPQEISASMA